MTTTTLELDKQTEAATTTALSKAASRQLDKLRKDIKKHVDACSAIEILDEDSADRALQTLALANRKLKEADKLRIDIKRPYLDAGNQIDSFFKDEIKSIIDPALEHGKKQVKKWNDHLAKLRQEELDRIETERKKREAAEAAELARIKDIRAKIDEFDKNARTKIRSSFLADPTDPEAEVPDGSIESIIRKLSAPASIKWPEIFAEQYSDFIDARSALLQEARDHKDWLLERRKIEESMQKANEEQKAQLQEQQRKDDELRAKQMKLNAEQEELRRKQEEQAEADRLREESEKRAADEEESKRSTMSFFAPTNTRNTWAYETTDFDQIPREYLMVDDAKVKAFMAQNKGGLANGSATIQGIKFFTKQGIVLR